MQFNLNSFGTLVRPRILNLARIYPRLNKTSEQERWNIISLVDGYYYDNREVSEYNETEQNLFKELKLGDTTKDLSSCYVGKITHIIISIQYRQYILVNSLNVKETIEKYKRRYKNTNNFTICFVGIKLFKGLKRNQDGKLEPINPWEITNNQDTWFYRPYDLLNMEHICLFENIKPGNLLFFKYRKGLAVKSKFRNKHKFYKINSWSSRTITIYMPKQKKYINILPNRKFQIK